MNQTEDEPTDIEGSGVGSPGSGVRSLADDAAGTFDDPRVIRALEDYRAALDAGLKPERREFQERYPEIAEGLGGCLAALDFVHTAAPALSRADRDSPESRNSTDPIIGTLGDFRILREIGRGGMGVVYEAQQLSLGRRVALKVLPFAAALDAKQLQRFKNEAQAAAHLHHTNIVPVFGIGCERAVHFYAMQFIEGQTLAAFIQDLRKQAGLDAATGAADSTGAYLPGCAPRLSGRGMPATPAIPDVSGLECPVTPRIAAISTEHSAKNPAFFRIVANLGVQAAEGLEHAHQMGVIHRDIKPANLLLDLRGNLWITDFGLAHYQSQAGLTMTGDLVGTLRYMSPEQALAKRVLVDHRTDVYSLAVTLYELLTLEPAYVGTDRQELLRQIAFEEPRKPRRLHKAIPPELETIVLKAMEKNPDERYATAQELGDDLRRYLEDKPIRARPPTVLHKTRKLLRRHQGVAWMAAGLLAVVAAGSAVSTVLIAGQLGRTEQAEKNARALAADATNNLVKAVSAEKEAQENLKKALAAERDKTEQLGKAKLAQAQAGRWSGRAGRVFDSLTALADAAQIARSLNAPAEHMLNLRNEAVACMTLPDLRPRPEFDKYTAEGTGGFFDGLLQRYATSDDQGNITIRRISADQVIRRLDGPGSRVRWMDFSPDGQFLAAIYYRASQSNSGHVLIWDLARGKITLRLPPEFADTPWLRGFRNHSAWSPDGRHYAVVSFPPGGRRGLVEPGTVAVYDVVARKEISRFTTSITRWQIAFHPRGKQLAILASLGVVEIRDVDTGRLLDRITFPAPAMHFAWGCDGRFLAASYAEDGTEKSFHIYLWDVPGGRMHKVLVGHRNIPIHLAFNHAGNLLASNGWDGTLRLWNPWTGKELLRTEGHWGTLQFSADDRFLLMGVAWSAVQRCWEVKGGPAYRELYSPLQNTMGFLGGGHVAFSPDGRLLASEIDGVRLWDVASAKHVASLSPDPRSTFSFEPNGKGIMTRTPDGDYRWPVSFDESQAVRQIRVGPAEQLPRENRSADKGDGKLHSPDGTWAVSNCSRIGDLNVPGKLHSPDGTWAVSVTGDVVSVWDARSGKRVRDLTGVGPGAWFSPDNKWLVTASPKECVFWEVGAWKLGLKIPTRQTIHGLAFSPDSKLLAVIYSAWEGIGLFDVAGQRQLAILTGPDHVGLNCFTFSPDGSQLAVLSANNMIQVWDLRAIRGQLAEMGLDWNLPPYPASPPSLKDEEEARLKPLEIDLDVGELIDREKYSLVIAFFPFHAEAYYRRGLAYTRFGQWSQASADFNMALALKPNHAEAHYQRGFFHALGRWQGAFADYNKAVELKPDHAQYIHALARLGTGDLPGYQRVCAEMLERFGRTDKPESAYWVAWACVLAPNAVQDLAQPAELAARAFRGDPKNIQYSVSLGAALYRAGRFQEAIRRLEEADNARELDARKLTVSPAYPRFFLAMAHYRLGHAEEARKWLDKAVQGMEQEMQHPGNEAGPPWNRRLTLQLLRREAEALVQGTGSDQKKGGGKRGEENGSAYTYLSPPKPRK